MSGGTAAYRQKKLAKEMAYAQFATSIAGALGEGWHGRGEGDFGARIEGPGGQHLLLRQDGYGEEIAKLEVLGIRPKDSPLLSDRDTRPTRIGVSVARGPERIAADIRRRLLPGYLEHLAEAHTYLERKASEAAHQAAVVEEITGLLPGSRPASWSHRSTSGQAEVFLDGPGGQSLGTVTLYTGARTAKLELNSIPMDLMRVVLEALAGEFARTRVQAVEQPDVHSTAA